MSTMLHASPVFGPVKSRRLGVSLGINLMPGDGKICSFDCIYCECGLNAERRPHSPAPTRSQVATALEARLQAMLSEGLTPDVLTFAGNGEPTCHPHFPEIMTDTVELRDRYFPNAKISVLSNATMIHKPEVRQALMMVDNNIQKLDTVCQDYILRLDRPNGRYDVEQVVQNLCLFQGHVIIQTMFLDGIADGRSVCNTGEEYVKPWIETLCRIKPQSVMIYTIDRETPLPTLGKAKPETLDAIAARVKACGIKTSVSY